MPPLGVLDKINNGGYNVGSKSLRNAVTKNAPIVHIFGHIHESHGDAKIGPTHFYNVAALDHRYAPIHKPTIIDFEIDR
jgi:Icc-related predicted phosphoesterase